MNLSYSISFKIDFLSFILSMAINILNPNINTLDKFISFFYRSNQMNHLKILLFSPNIFKYKFYFI